MQVMLNGRRFPVAEASSKKTAKKDAAAVTLKTLLRELGWEAEDTKEEEEEEGEEGEQGNMAGRDIANDPTVETTVSGWGLEVGWPVWASDAIGLFRHCFEKGVNRMSVLTL